MGGHGHIHSERHACARGHGLETCPQASLAEYPDTHALICGMALGYADAGAPVNSYRTEREPVSTFTTWHD
jgi:hypothetical protein